MKQALLIATRNRHKTGEIARMLGEEWAVRDLTEHPEMPEMVESGSTFEENAVIKAEVASRELPGLVLADDSGLEVDALKGAPGVYSARYSGAKATDEENRRHLLAELARLGVCEAEDLRARFQCAMALAEAGKVLATFMGTVEGRLVLKAAGKEGFGYDPLFVPDGYDVTFGELDLGTKNQISHRARALGRVLEWLRDKASQG